ncbi:MAG: NADH-quinone oxidoreductase subunit C [Bacillota bacterium]|nr:NADH-quinone oxidoreductase subunit C [Bacillota bacterium]
MEKEASILQEIAKRFISLEGAGLIPAERRIYLEVPQEIFMDVIKFAAKELGFKHLCTITGMDSASCFEFIYHISNDDGIVLNLELKAQKENPVISSVLPVYNGAVFYERELEGMLGVKVSGLPEGRQYPLPDNWPAGQFPLRKDWKPDKTAKEEGPDGKN